MNKVQRDIRRKKRWTTSRPPSSVCRIGNYCQIVDHDSQRQRNFGLEVVLQPQFRIFVCDGCGHSRLFYSMDGIRPRAWMQ